MTQYGNITSFHFKATFSSRYMGGVITALNHPFLYQHAVFKQAVSYKGVKEQRVDGSSNSRGGPNQPN